MCRLKGERALRCRNKESILGGNFLCAYGKMITNGLMTCRPTVCQGFPLLSYLIHAVTPPPPPLAPMSEA